MLKFLTSVIFLLSFGSGISQRISADDLTYLKSAGDTLKEQSAITLDSENFTERFKADSLFTKVLVRAMVKPYSFYYNFPEVSTTSFLYAPDSSFRIITWHLSLDNTKFRQRGVIQMNTKDGAIKIFPLFDVSDFTDNPLDSVRTPRNWIGAIYYKMLLNKHNNKNYYTLLGYDENNLRSTKKWMEVLWFNERQEPIFGGSIYLPSDSLNPKPRLLYRYNIEYKKGTTAKFNYDEDDKIIVQDNLMSESNDANKKFTYVASGYYEGFEWKNGQWVNIPQLYTQNLGEDNAPTPHKIIGKSGFIEEEEDALPPNKTKDKKKPKKKSK